MQLVGGRRVVRARALAAGVWTVWWTLSYSLIPKGVSAAFGAPVDWAAEWPPILVGGLVSFLVWFLGGLVMEDIYPTAAPPPRRPAKIPPGWIAWLSRLLWPIMAAVGFVLGLPGHNLSDTIPISNQLPAHLANGASSMVAFLLFVGFVVRFQIPLFSRAR